MIRVLLADDHGLFRKGLRSLLEKEQDIEIIAEASDGEEALRLAKQTAPDLILLDVSMPNLSGIAVMKRLMLTNSASKVIGLSMHKEKEFVLEMIRAGASGYLIKDSLLEDLITAIRTVMSGKCYIASDVAHLLLSELSPTASARAPKHAELLSEREREVLKLLAEGKTSKEIASFLIISTRTVENHRHHIMKKLNLHSTAELTKFAIQNGVVSLS